MVHPRENPHSHFMCSQLDDKRQRRELRVGGISELQRLFGAEMSLVNTHSSCAPIRSLSPSSSSISRCAHASSSGNAPQSFSQRFFSICQFFAPFLSFLIVSLLAVTVSSCGRMKVFDLVSQFA